MGPKTLYSLGYGGKPQAVAISRNDDRALVCSATASGQRRHKTSRLQDVGMDGGVGWGNLAGAFRVYPSSSVNAIAPNQPPTPIPANSTITVAAIIARFITHLQPWNYNTLRNCCG